MKTPLTVQAVAVVQALREPFNSSHIAAALGVSTPEVSYITKSMSVSGWIVSVRVGANRRNWYRRTPTYGVTAAVRGQQTRAGMDALDAAMRGWRLEHAPLARAA